jgi:erythromycin esterase
MTIAPSGSPENIQLLEWMREYNQDSAHKIKLKIYGMDIQIKGLPGDTTPAHEALDQALDYLQRIDPPLFARVSNVLKSYLPRLSVGKYPLLSQEEHDQLSAGLDDLIAIFVSQRIDFLSKSSAADYEWAYRSAIVARQTDRMVRVMPPEEPGKIPAEAWQPMNMRDAAMAENVLWVLNNLPKGEKILVFAHNAHVKNAATTGSVWDAFARPPHAIGQYLRSRLGSDLYILGASVGASKAAARPGSFDVALSRIGRPRFFLDLRPAVANPQVDTWLSAVRPMEANTVHFLNLAPGKAFDGIVYFDKTR